MRLATICLGACALLPLSAQADPVTLSFSAIVSQSSSGYPGVGSIITGSFVFDRDPSTYQAPPLWGYDPNQLLGYTYAAGGPYGMRLQYPDGGTPPDFSPVGGAVTVSDGFYGSDTAWFAAKRDAISYSLTLDGGIDSFAGTALPIDQWITGGWTSAFFRADDSNFNRVLTAAVTSVTVAPVPEPATTALMLLGLGTVWGARRRATRNRDVMTA